MNKNKPIVHKEKSEYGEIFIYMNGKLLYKKWPDGNSILFEKYGMPTSKANRDMGHY